MNNKNQRIIELIFGIFDRVEEHIMRLERIKQRTDSEEAELDVLIDESAMLFRTIEALKEGLNGY